MGWVPVQDARLEVGKPVDARLLDALNRSAISIPTLFTPPTASAKKDVLESVSIEPWFHWFSFYLKPIKVRCNAVDARLQIGFQIDVTFDREWTIPRPPWPLGSTFGPSPATLNAYLIMKDQSSWLTFPASEIATVVRAAGAPRPSTQRMTLIGSWSRTDIAGLLGDEYLPAEMRIMAQIAQPEGGNALVASTYSGSISPAMGPVGWQRRA